MAIHLHLPRGLPLAALAALLTVAVSYGETASTSPASAAAPPSPLRLVLMDGSQVSGKISIAELTVETAFGTLKIPFDAVRSFTPGLASHPEFSKKVAALVTDLSADGFAQREAAQAAVLKMGPAMLPQLREALKFADAEKQARLQKVVDDFEAQLENDDGADPMAAGGWVQNDVVVTNAFTIAGHITTTGFAVTNSYGTLQLKLDDIEHAYRESSETAEVRKNVTVAGGLIASQGFIDAVRVAKGDEVSISAGGTITMTPWGNRQSGPDGLPNFGMVNNIPGGALVAKVGDGGSAFKVGAKDTFRADRAGMLRFSVSMPGDFENMQFPGEYQVKLKVVHRQ